MASEKLNKEEKFFTVTFEVEAPNEEYVEKMFANIPHGERIYDEEIVDRDKPRLECRIRYDANWNGQGEYFVFENKWTDEEGWGLDCAFPLCSIDIENGKVEIGKGDLLNYQALTKIRELKHLGVHFYFA